MKLFIDMDGTIAKWQPEKTFKEVSRSGYFQNLPEIPGMIRLVEMLENTPDMTVFILSSILSNPYAHYVRQEKCIWLDKYLPMISDERRIFVPARMKKSEYLGKHFGYFGVRQSDVLLDDFSKNLHEWHGIGIKVMNGINGTNGTWQGARISIFDSPDVNYKKIKELIKQ